MPTLTYPGVYVQEISSGVRPITAASTSTAAFVGLAERGPEEATRVTNWPEFLRLFGSFFADGYLAHSVFQYFNNGGRQCYIVRVTRSDATTASVTLNNRASAPLAGVLFSAKNKGAWGNSLLLQIEDGSLDPGNLFKVSIREQPDPAVVPANVLDSPPLEVFDNLSMDPAAPNFVATTLAQNSTLVSAQVPSGNTSLQRGLHRGALAPTVPLPANTSFQINLDGDGMQPVTLPAAATLADVATAVQAAVRALTRRKVTTDPTAFTGFTAAVETVGAQSRLLLQSGTTAVTSSVRVQASAANDATGLLRIGALGRSEDGIAVRRPVRVDTVQVGDSAVAAPVAAATPGSDGVAALGDTTFSNAFPRLDSVADFSLLAVPGEGTAALAGEGMGYCARRPLQDVFYLAEMASHDDDPDAAATFRGNINTVNSFGALYFPWLKALDPTGRSKAPILLPPAGYVAGLYARIDSTRGVWKAPAGTGAGLSGVVGLATELTDVQHGNLNPLGVNVIRRFPASGVVVFGARTITSDAEWRYVPVRRTAIMLKTSIFAGIQFAVFEPNDEPLWAQLRLNVGAFMMSLFRQGAFQGSTPSQAFFVKCDSQTTTQTDIDNGVVNVLVGFAPLKPAEFVVVTVSQQAGLASG
jgi:uncharacterized protein